MPAGSGSASRQRSASRREPDAAFVLDVRSLGRRAGTMRELRRTVTTVTRIGLDLIGVPVGAEVKLDLQLQAVSEGVLVTGSVVAPIEGECSRCLESFTDELDVHLTELFAYPDSTTEQTTDDDDAYRMIDDTIDLEPVIIDAIGIELPLQPLCTPDCAGLCAECGVRMAIAGSDHSHEILDPRWAGLAKFATASPGNGSPDTGAATAADQSADMASNRTEEK
ncbi:YceD family protein [Nocardia sp. NPDC049149]|uniref:YceD family protein n=1 Tax=Nocardia sp. NPDC049149 TaxID=3364315 RepID=UPI00371F0E31